MKKLYLVDGSGFIFRAYHSLPPLTSALGIPVGAVYGFITMMLKLQQMAKSDAMVVVFDAGRHTFRNRIYSDYKAHRPPPPDDLIPQFPLVREASIALGLPTVELADYEADDVIATYTAQARALGMEVIIVSSDKDLMQLIEENGVSMFDGMKNKTIGATQVLEKFGVSPDKVRDVLALMGDSSDNIPGVPGIGPKTAAELITQFGSLEQVLARAGEIKQQKRREVLIENADKARISYELVGLCYTAPLPLSIAQLTAPEVNTDTLMPFLRKMGFKSLIAKWEQASPAPQVATPAPLTPNPDAPKAYYTLIQDEAMLIEWLSAAKLAGKVAFDTETTSLQAMTAQLVGFSLSYEPGKACYVPLQHVTRHMQGAAQGSLFGSKEEGTLTLVPVANQLPLEVALKHLIPFLADPSVLKIGQNIKYDMLVLRKYGVTITPYDDTMMLSYLLGAGLHTHNMDDLAERHLGHKTISYNSVTGTGKSRLSFAEVPLDKALDYAAEDAEVTLRLWKALKPRVIAEKMLTLYETIERPLAAVIVAMEEAGILVDKAYLSLLSNDFAERMAVLETEIYQLAGHPFNIASPKQLGDVLFKEMGLSVGKKSSKTGEYSTGAQVLEELAFEGHVLPAKILDWRQLAKLKSTYTDALVEDIIPSTGRVHTSYAMAATTTGRLSSSEPNLQNIPIRSEEGKKIRHAFIAASGTMLISADYSQIELRLLAHMADITPLKQAFRDGDDIHAITASQMFGIALEQVDGDLRRKAKTINFGIIYGISAHGLAARLGISRTEAAQYIERYFTQYPGIQAYMERTKQEARDHGYVSTLFGRRCYIPGIHDKNGGVRQFSERAAINAPLQGTAADIIKRAMIAVQSYLKTMPARLLLQVHDELVIEAPDANAEVIAGHVRHLMENAAFLSVPLTANVNIGPNWGEAH